MKIRQTLITLVFLTFCTGMAQAEALNGKKLREAVSGKTIYLSLAAGVELPIKYRPSGTMSGKMKGLIALLPSGIPSNDKGRWWISKGKLCQIWNQWLKQRSYCYKFSKVNGTVTWQRNDGKSGTARIVSH